MRQFDQTQTILRHHVVSVPPAMTRRDMDVMFDNYLIHMVQEKARCTITESDCSYVEWCIMWFFRMSHLYMVLASLGDLLSLAHQDILEKEQTQLDHVHDVLPRCRCIMETVYASIDKGIFPNGSEVRQILYAIMTEARETLMYR